MFRKFIAPFVPPSNNAGSYYAKKSMKGEFKRGKDQKKPVEGFHFKAIESGILDRYQTALVNERRPSWYKYFKILN